jgi:oxalate---CoA ligase
MYRGIGSDSLALPSSIEELLGLDIKETQPATSAWDFMWNAVTEDRREKQLFAKSMLVDEVNPAIEVLYETDEMYITEAAVKVRRALPLHEREPCSEGIQMVVGTPNERYGVEAATQLLQRFGDNGVSSAAESMLERSIFSKTVRDPKKPKPGRPLKISDQYVSRPRRGSL